MLNNGEFYFVCPQARAGAGARSRFFFGADVVAPAFVGAAVHECAAVRAMDEAAEQVDAGDASRVVVVGVDFDVAAADGLHGFPLLGGAERGDEVFQPVAGEVIVAEVDFVAVKGDVGADGFEEPRFVVDFPQAAAFRAHLPGELSTLPEFFVRDPARDDARGAVAFDADFDGLPLVAARRGAGGVAGVAAVRVFGGDEREQAALGVGGNVEQIALRFPIYERFDERLRVAGVGEVVCQEDEGVAAPAQVRFEVLGVVEIAREAVLFPEQDAGDVRLPRLRGATASVLFAGALGDVIRARAAEAGDHFIEAHAADGGRSGLRAIGEGLMEGEMVLAGVVRVGGELLVY